MVHHAILQGYPYLLARHGLTLPPSPGEGLNGLANLIGNLEIHHDRCSDQIIPQGHSAVGRDQYDGVVWVDFIGVFVAKPSGKGL